MADWSYTITHYYSGGTQNISSDIISIPLFTDTGSGEVNEAEIVLNAVDGQFISANINSKTIISQYDRIRITVADGLTAQGTQAGAYDKFFYVMKKQPIKSKDTGVRLQLDLLGTESYLQRIQYAKPHYFETPFEVFKSIGNLYNENRGSSSNMPTISGHDSTSYNKLPNWLVNTYDYGVNEDNCFDRMGDVIDSMGASQSAGGALDFYDLRFTYTNNGLTIHPNVFSSGNDYGSGPGGQTIVTIDNSTAVNVGETDGGIDAKTGTQVLAWGATESGSLPTDFSKFWAKQQWWNLFFPAWDSSVTYQTGAKVSHVVSGVRNNYISSTNNNTSEPATNWTLSTPKSYYGDVHQYSPWTSGKATTIWTNGSADPTHSYGLNDSGGKHYFWDHNLTINDGYFWRTTADVKSTSDEIGSTHGSKIPAEYCYDTTGNGTGDSFYRGLRVLVIGNPTAYNGKYFGYTGSAATVTDVNGKKIANSVLQYDGTQWKVYARPFKDQFDSTSDPLGVQCTVMDEAKTYRFNKNSNSTWDDITDDDMGNDAFHPIIYEDSEYKITNVPGVLADDTGSTIKDVNDSNGPYEDYPWNTVNANSAVEVVYDWGPVDVKARDSIVLPAAGGIRDNEDFYQVGAYISTRFPFPITSYNSISEDVGDLFGGGTNTNNPKEPTTVDTQNMHMTHDGKKGFNHSTSEDLGQINAIAFNMKLKYQQKSALTGNTYKNVVGEAGANFKMRCALWDTDDNCVIQDFTIFFQDHWQSIVLPISGFQIFKSREPRYASNIEYFFIQPKGIDVQNIFVWRNLKSISIYTIDQYDEYGRYAPGLSGRYCDGTDTARKIYLTLDALRFQKPLLATTGALTGDVIQPDFIEKPEISNYEQLKSDAEAEKQKHLHQRVEFDVTTTGRFDVGFGDYFNLTDKDIIPSNLQDSSNTIKLVAKRIEYSISKPLNGKGGFLRRIRGVRRFT